MILLTLMDFQHVQIKPSLHAMPPHEITRQGVILNFPQYSTLYYACRNKTQSCSVWGAPHKIRQGYRNGESLDKITERVVKTRVGGGVCQSVVELTTRTPHNM